jgi:uncharacterized membrane protein YccC
MRHTLREAAIIAAAGTFLAGPLAALLLALAPEAWRGPNLAWVIWAACLGLVALRRRRRRRCRA